MIIMRIIPIIHKMINRKKSNLKIKVKTKKKTEQIFQNKSRKQIEKQLLTNVDLIFGLDNGATGSIACLSAKGSYVDFQETPTIESYDYTKEIQKINRINVNLLKEWFQSHINFIKNNYNKTIKIIVVLERPMVNPQRFKQSRICIKSI